MMKIIQENRTALILMAVVIIAGGAFMFYRSVYKPAVAERSSAQLAASGAQQQLSEAQGRLNAAQQQIDSAKKENGGKFDESIGRLQLASMAITPKADIDDAMIVLTKYADRSGVSTVFDLADPTDTGAGSSDSGTMTELKINLTLAGTWGELKQFIALVEGPVESKKGKLHVRGRLFNVQLVKMSAQGTTQNGDPSAANALKVRKGDYVYEMTIVMYSSSFSGDGGAAATAPTTGTGAATGTTPGATGTATPGTTGTTGTATGTGTTPGATPGTGTSTGTTPGGATGSTGAIPGATPGATPGAATGSVPGASTTPSSTVPQTSGSSTPLGAGQ